MISHAHRCIFTHQRKCAGTSIIRAFGLAPDNAAWHFMNDGVLSPEYARMPAGYYRFSVIRNPWERFISGWKYCSSTRHRALQEVLANLPREGHDYRHLTRPQHEILYEATGCLAVDFLIRFESLQQDFDRVCDLIGKPRCTLGRYNAGPPPPPARHTDGLNGEDRNLFLRHFGRDIELFGYGDVARSPPGFPR